MRNLWKENIISKAVKKEFYERVVIPTAVNSPETWSLREQKRRNTEVFNGVFKKYKWHKKKV